METLPSVIGNCGDDMTWLRNCHRMGTWSLVVVVPYQAMVEAG